MSTEWGYDEHLGATALLLEAQGETQAAALLLDATDLGYTYLDTLFGRDDGDRLYKMRALVECPPLLYTRVTPEIETIIRDALGEVAYRDQMFVDQVSFVVGPADESWRGDLETRLGFGPSNQARVAPAKETFPRKDNLVFRDPSEVKVYEALKRAGAQLPDHNSILIAPNAGVRVRGKTIEVDFLVTYKGRAGIIEVDGATHHGRRVADKTREKLLEDAGIVYVDRFAVEDTTSETDLDLLVERFLHKLGS